jgi:hypothetical protein
LLRFDIPFVSPRASIAARGSKSPAGRLSEYEGFNDSLSE